MSRAAATNYRMQIRVETTDKHFKYKMTLRMYKPAEKSDLVFFSGSIYHCIAEDNAEFIVLEMVEWDSKERC